MGNAVLAIVIIASGVIGIAIVVPLFIWAAIKDGDNPAALERRRIHWPMGRLAEPREIVNGALFLASDESSYVNGATFLVDGGLTAAYVTPE